MIIRPAFGRYRVRFLFVRQCPSDSHQLSQNAERAARRRQTTVTVAGPVDGKFLYPVTFLLGPHYDFYIESKSVGNTFAVQVSRDIPFVYLKAALGIGEFRRDFHIVNHKPVEYPGADSPVQTLWLLDMAAPHFSRPVGYITRIVF